MLQGRTTALNGARPQLTCKLLAFSWVNTLLIPLSLPADLHSTVTATLSLNWIQ